MTTCMETWIVAEPNALREQFGRGLRPNEMLANLESRSRSDIQNSLERATRDWAARYSRERWSCDGVGKINPGTLESHVSSLGRVRRVLEARLSR